MSKRPWCTPAELADWLDVHPKTLAKWRAAKQGPRWIKVGRTVRYLWADVHAWATDLRKAAR